MKPILFNTEMVRAILDGRKTVTRRVIKTESGEPLKYGQGFVIAGDRKSIGKYAYGNRAAGEPIRCVKPPYKVNDILYVRETYRWLPCFECGRDLWAVPCKEGKFNHAYGNTGCYVFKADIHNCDTDYFNWKPSIHMPKEAARIFLKVTGVRVERLWDITEEQAKAEGVIRLYDNDTDTEYTDWTKRIGLYPKSKEEWGYKNYLWHGNFGKCGSGNWQSDLWDYQYSSYDTAVGSFSSLWQSTLQKDQLQYYGWNANPYVWVIEFEVIDKAAALKEGQP